MVPHLVQLSMRQEDLCLWQLVPTGLIPKGQGVGVIVPVFTWASCRTTRTRGWSVTVRTPEGCFGIADWVGMVEACDPTCDAEGPADSVEFASSLTLFTLRCC